MRPPIEECQWGLQMVEGGTGKDDQKGVGQGEVLATGKMSATKNCVSQTGRPGQPTGQPAGQPVKKGVGHFIGAKWALICPPLGLI